jgi:hypothetical protein
MSELTEERRSRIAASDERRRAGRRERALRFHAGLNAAYAAAALGLLKIEGPYFADAIAAGLFFCGFWMALFSLRSLSSLEREGSDEAAQPRRTVGARPMFIAFAVFYLASAVAIVWLTYINPSESTQEDAAAASIARLEACSGCDL